MNTTMLCTPIKNGTTLTFTVAPSNSNPNILDYILPNRSHVGVEVNRSLMSISERTYDERVKTIADFLIANPEKKFTATFIKRDKSLRSLTFVPRNEWNRTNGITSTWYGRQMVANKATRGMMTVVELLDVGGHRVMQPRTLNLGTIVELKLAA